MNAQSTESQKSSRSSTSRPVDTRSQSQPALAVFHTNFCDVAFSQSTAVLEGKVGPCPLVRVSEVHCFGEDEKPNPSARTEQPHGFIFNTDFALKPQEGNCPLQCSHLGSSERDGAGGAGSSLLD